MSNIISLILIVASLGLFFFYINPTYSGTTNATTFKEKSIKELRSDEAQYAAALTKTREISEIQSGLLSQFNSIPRENREKLSKLLPDHVNTVHLILDINRIVNRHDMVLENISITSVGSSGDGGETAAQSFGPQNTLFDSVGLSFTVAGKYETFLQFIEDLEKSLRLIDITSLKFATAVGDEYHYTFNIRTYFLK